VNVRAQIVVDGLSSLGACVGGGVTISTEGQPDSMEGGAGGFHAEEGGGGSLKDKDNIGTLSESLGTHSEESEERIKVLLRRY
jgi:hypothetical protein